MCAAKKLIRCAAVYDQPVIVPDIQWYLGDPGVALAIHLA